MANITGLPNKLGTESGPIKASVAILLAMAAAAAVASPSAVAIFFVSNSLESEGDWKGLLSIVLALLGALVLGGITYLAIGITGILKAFPDAKRRLFSIGALLLAPIVPYVGSSVFPSALGMFL